MSPARLREVSGNVVLVAMAIAAIIVLYHKTRAVDPAEQERYAGRILALRHLDAAIDQDVLRIRQGYLRHYDTLDANLGLMEEGIAALAAVPASCDAASRGIMLGAVERYRQAIAGKREDIEAFKSDRAIFANSLRYLPGLVDSLTTDGAVSAADRAIAERLHRVLQAILVYNLHGLAAEVDAIRADIDGIRADIVPGQVSDDARVAIDHATRILDYKPRVDQETARILAPSGDLILDAITGAFADSNRIAAVSGNIYRLALIAVCAALAIGLAHFVYRLRQVNGHLEQRVRERTAALSQANADLGIRIEERQRAIAGLEAARARIQQILSIMPSVLIGTDGSRRIVLWNIRAELQFGIPADHALGRDLAECGITWDFAALRGRLAGIEQGPVHLTDVPYARPGGQPGILAVSACQLPGEQAEAGLLLAATDITSLKAMESQLMQAQKLESIGQLAAGVAHEINTPVQFVGDNLRFLQTACRDLVPVLTAGQALVDEAGAGAAAVDGLRQAMTAADTAFLVDEMPKAIAQALEGVERVATIVKSLKEFSHPDNGEVAAVDLRKAIESTLNVARSEYKYVADLVTDFAEDLPGVECQPGELNQVILNLMVNAAHAIGDVVGAGGARGTITVSTRRDGETAEIRIADTGTGIPVHVRERIFDPFFTTKEVGKGTGQGLSLARTIIVQKHQGTLTFETELGRGTTFIIRLPIRRAGVAA
jgi:signal transduction histidine kinase